MSADGDGPPNLGAEERRAWILVAGLFSVLTVSSGLGFYNLSLYMHVLADVRVIPVAALSACISVYFLAGGVAGLWVGRLLQRGDARHVITVGAVTGGVALALIGQADSVGELMAVYLLFGIGNAGVGLLPATTLVTRWFDARRRPLALSITSTGLSLGGVLLTPLSVTLLERANIDVAMPLLGLIYVLGIAPIAWLTVRSQPRSRSLAASPHADAPGVAYRDAARSRFFRTFTAAYVVLMGSQVAGIAHLYNRGTEVASTLDAAFAVSVLATLSISGRLLGGWLLSWVPIRGFTLVNIFGQATGLLVLAFAQSTGVLWLGAALFGFTVGNLLMMQPLILSYAFGLRDYARLFSLNQAITTVGVAGGPLLIGWIQGVVDYRLAFMVVATLSAASLLMLVAAGPVPRASG